MSTPTIPGYTIRSVLGTGGSATVYLAQHHSLQRDVALKVMHPNLVSDAEFCSRFLVEARDTASISDHRNIVTIYDFGCIENVYFIAMQYMPGATLSQQILTPSASDMPERWLYQLADSLSYIHSRGLIHRDIKPANVLFNETGEAVLSDFGVARQISRLTNLQNKNRIVGTARYMSPEQCRADPDLDARSDLYSLGVVFYEMLTGYAPYQSADPMALMLEHLHGPTPQLPPPYQRYQALLERLMAKEPSERYDSAEHLMRAMRGKDKRRGETNIDTKHDQDASQRGSKHMDNTALAPIVTITICAALLVAGSVAVVFRHDTATLPAMSLRCPSLTQAELDQRDSLMELAGIHKAVGRIHHPQGANALDAYKLALQIDPCNEDLADAISQIAEAEM